PARHSTTIGEPAKPTQTELLGTARIVRRLALTNRKPATRRAANNPGGRDTLTIERRRHGRGFGYYKDGRPIRDARTIQRLASLAMPPAYADVVYASNPSAPLQAMGRDAAGRWQYRYHPDWVK